MPDTNSPPDTTVPVVLSGQVAQQLTSTWQHDILINGLPFRLWPSDNQPYIRDLQDDKKDQFDNAPVAGEQTFGYWWLRSQPSWHGGSGQIYLDSLANEANISRIRFQSSSLAWPWRPGEVGICTPLTGSVASVKRVKQVTWSGTQKLVTMSSVNNTVTVQDLPNLINPVVVTLGTTGTCQDMTTDGVNVYVAIADSIYKIVPGGTATKITSQVFSGVVTLGFAKQRLILCLGNKVYDCDPNPPTPPATPTLKFTNPAANYTYTSIGDGPQGIYLAGYSGIMSEMASMSVTDVSGTITLGAPVVNWRSPPGEIINAVLFYVSGLFVLATSNGVRVGMFSLYTGQPQPGAIIMPGVRCTALAGSGQIVYVGANNSIYMVDLGVAIDQAGRYASALLASGLNNADPTDYVPDLVIYGTGSVNVASSNYVYAVLNNAAQLTYNSSYAPATATVTTSWARFGTTEPKRLHYVTIEGNFPVVNGVPAVLSVTATGSDGSTQTFSVPGGMNQYEFGVNLPPAGAFQVTVKISDTGTGNNVLLRTVQLKALPAPRRFREMVLPLRVADWEVTPSGQRSGYRGFAKDRLLQLEDFATKNQVVTVVDRTTGVNFQAVVRRSQFMQVVVPSRTNILEGVCNLVLRLV